MDCPRSGSLDKAELGQRLDAVVETDLLRDLAVLDAQDRGAIAPLGAERQGPFKVPGGPLSEADYRKAVEESGFAGKTIVGTDLGSLRLPAR
jgi:hypothetical protein